MAGERRGNVVRDGYTVVARRPRGAAPGNIVSMERAAEFEDTSEAIETIYGDDFHSRRLARLDRVARDVHDDEPYLDYEG